MRTTTYLVHDAETGEVVLVHVEPAELASAPEEIVHLAGPADGRRLLAVRVPDGADAGPARVVDGELRAGDSPNWGHATVADGAAEPALPRRYSPG